MGKIALEVMEAGNPVCPNCRRWHGMCFDEQSKTYTCGSCSYKLMEEEVELVDLPKYKSVWEGIV